MTRSCSRSAARLALGMVIVGLAARADAQEAPRDPVAEAPLHLGVAGVAPTFAVTNVGVDSNVFNSIDDPRQDFTVTASPGARVWLRTQRGLLSLDGRVDFVYFATYASERSANTAGSIRYEYPFLRVRPFASYSALGTRERPGYEIDARARRREDALRVGAAFPVGSVSTLDIARRREHVAFDGDVVFGGPPLKRALDRTLDAWDLDWQQAFTVVTTWVVRASREEERFEFAPDRNSNSVRVGSGLQLGLFALVRGEAFVGYRRLTGAAGGTLPEFSGLTSAVDVSYTAPSQSRLRIAIDRDLHYSFDLERPYYVQTGWTLTGTQRVIGPWDVQVSGGRDRLSYKGADRSGGRLDRISRVGGGIGYEAGEHMRVGVDVLVQRRHSPVSVRDYQSVKVGGSVTYGY